MAQTILIKRSTSTAVPTSLLNGELAYSSFGDGKLFIGRPGGQLGDVDAIGGKYFTDIITGATDAATVSKLVLRDASGDFAANMITSDLTGAVTGTVSDISNHSTTTLSEGTNKYYTNARARASISATGSLGYDSATGAVSYTQGDTDTVAEGATNLYYTETRARASISATGSLSYDLGTGAVSYTTPTTIASIANHDTADLIEGTNLYHTTERAQDAAAAMITGATHSNISVVYNDSTNTLAFTAASQYSDGDSRAAISVTDAGGDGSLSYASGTGVITYTGPSSTEVRAHISGGTGITVTDGEIATTITQYTDTAAGTVFDTKLTAADTDDLSEGSTNQYHTTARARGVLSASTSGDTNLGTLGYNSSTGVISFTRPSIAQFNGEVNESLIAGTGVTKSTTALGSDVTLAIGQAVGTTDDVTFNDVTVDGTLTSNDITSSAISIDGNATITGNLTVEGTTTTVNSTTVEIGDNILVLNKQLAADTAPSTNAGFTVYRGTGLGAKDSVSLLWNEVNGYWTVQEGDDASTTSKLMTADNWSNSFTGTIDGGTF